MVPGILFVVLLIPVGFVLGMVVGAPFVPPNSGLVGGAIVFWYGVIGVVVALLLGLVLAINLPRPYLVKGVWLAVLGVMMTAAFMFYRYQVIQKERAADPVEEVAPKNPPTTTVPVQ